MSMCVCVGRDVHIHSLVNTLIYMLICIYLHIIYSHTHTHAHFWCVCVCVRYLFRSARRDMTRRSRIVTHLPLCCSVLQCVAECCSVLHWDMTRRSRIETHLPVCCSVLQCVAVCLQCVALRHDTSLSNRNSSFTVLQCVAECCSVFAVCSTVTWHVALESKLMIHDSYVFSQLVVSPDTRLMASCTHKFIHDRCKGASTYTYIYIHVYMYICIHSLVVSPDTRSHQFFPKFRKTHNWQMFTRILFLISTNPNIFPLSFLCRPLAHTLFCFWIHVFGQKLNPEENSQKK